MSTSMHTHHSTAINVISSEKNPSIKLAKQLLTSSRQRKKSGLTVIEGTHLLDACLRANYPIKQVLVAENAWKSTEVCELVSRLQTQETQVQDTVNTQAIPILTITDKCYQEIRTLGTGIDIMAILPVKQHELPEITNTDCLILNDVQDSGNVGTLLRTAAAVGITQVICTSGTAQAWSPKVLRAGMGANFSLQIYENITIDDILAKVTVPMFATSSHTNTLIYQADLSAPVAWVMGHEGQGVCDDIMNQAHPVTIPQPNGQESLNVAIAGALCLYEAVRQRNWAD